MARHARYLMLGLLLQSICFPAYAADWATILSKTDKANNEIISAKKQMDASGWMYNRSFTNFLPQISANASMGESVYGSDTERTYSIGLGATQSLFKGFENLYGMELAHSGYMQDKAALINARASAYYSVRVAFIDLLVAQQNIALLRKILDQRKENSRLL